MIALQVNTDSIIYLISQVLGEAPKGLEFLYVLLGGLLLIFVFHLLEHILEILFGKFFNH